MQQGASVGLEGHPSHDIDANFDLDAWKEQVTDTEAQQLGGGRPHLGKRRWDDALQRQVDEASGTDMPWHDFAQDRAQWQAEEAKFVASRVARPDLPRTR